MRKLTLIIFLLLVTGIISCAPNYEEIFTENNQKFDKNRAKLNHILLTLEKTYLKKWDRKKELTLYVKNISGEIKDELKELGIGSIVIAGNPKDDCEKKYWITFNVIENWNVEKLKRVQLVYAPCDSKGEIKDRKKRSDYISNQDFWGQGENWFIFSDTDEY